MTRESCNVSTEKRAFPFLFWGNIRVFHVLCSQMPLGNSLFCAPREFALFASDERGWLWALRWRQHPDGNDEGYLQKETLREGCSVWVPWVRAANLDQGEGRRCWQNKKLKFHSWAAPVTWLGLRPLWSLLEQVKDPTQTHLHASLAVVFTHKPQWAAASSGGRVVFIPWSTVSPVSGQESSSMKKFTRGKEKV